jgi:DNA-binding response OmpR family regulator
MHALIIEDEIMIAAAIEFVLRDCGFNSFDIASTSIQAIRAAAGRCPNLITADITLAEGDGIEAIRIICRKPTIPVIFITGHSAVDARAQVPDYPVLTKPFSEQTLTYTVAASLGR